MNNRGEVRRATFPQLKKVTPMEALITKIPMNLRYGRQAKYLKSTLPEVLREVTEDPVQKQITGKTIPGTQSLSKTGSSKQGVPENKTKKKTDEEGKSSFLAE